MEDDNEWDVGSLDWVDNMVGILEDDEGVGGSTEGDMVEGKVDGEDSSVGSWDGDDVLVGSTDVDCVIGSMDVESVDCLLDEDVRRVVVWTDDEERYVVSTGVVD